MLTADCIMALTEGFAIFGKVHRRRQSHRHSQQYGAGSTVDAGEYEGQYAKGGGSGRRSPSLVEEEWNKTYPAYCRYTRYDQIYRDEQNAAYCYKAEHKEVRCASPIQAFSRSFCFSSYCVSSLKAYRQPLPAALYIPVYQFTGTAPAAVITSAAWLEVAYAKNFFAVSESSTPSLVTSTKGRCIT